MTVPYPSISRRVLIACLVPLSMHAWHATAWASGDWPSKPIKLIVAFPPGSSPDVIGRALAPGLAEALKQPVVVENRTGVTGMIAAEFVARSPADGYTFLMTSGSSVTISVHTLAKVPIDPSKDLVPVASTARIELFLVSDARQEFKSFAELVATAKARPGSLSYASPGNGSAPHVAAEMMKAQSGMTAVHIPYRGASPALQDLLGGSVQFAFDPGIALEHVRAGKLRLLAVGSTKRSPLFPGTPTLQELGLNGFDSGTTHAIYAPAKTPVEIVERMNAEINTLLASPHVTKIIRNLGAEPTPLSPAELADQLRRDSARYAEIVKLRGIKE
ncbi:Bug family tripartite tricarboxylate transporter substrate binding protein [Ottowia thiooxydans]|uniref:Bug family tripartite tricarboxylate transporter substrate binding protein n=1 Tax=Ottowia thiooxydans TaxID=219182 RepID=UPI0003FB46B7|nr:tripartite tricarboxylate transporter substrate binding protein [Ottowia thiooxydans]